MRWAHIQNKEIVEVVQALPTNFVHNGKTHNVRTMWGQNKDTEVNSLGWFKCDEETPKYNEWTHKETEDATTAFVGDRLVSTIILAELTATEINDKVFNEKIKLRIRLKDCALSAMHEFMPSIETFDSVALVSALWDTIDDSAKTNTNCISEVIELHKRTSALLSQIDAICTVSELHEFPEIASSLFA